MSVRVTLLAAAAAGAAACVDWSVLPATAPGPAEGEGEAVAPPPAEAWLDLGERAGLRSVSGSAGRVFVGTEEDGPRGLGEIVAPDADVFVNVACGTLRKSGPVHVVDDGTLLVGLLGGVGRIDPDAGTCDVFDDGVPDGQGSEPPCVGLAVDDRVAVWNGSAVLVYDSPTVAPVTLAVPTPGGLPHAAVLSRDGDTVQVVLQRPLLERGPFAAIAVTVNVATGTVGDPREDVGTLLRGQPVSVQIVPGDNGLGRALAIGFGTRVVRTPIFGNEINVPEGDRPFFAVADDVGNRVFVGGPSGLLVEATPAGAESLGGPRLPQVGEFVPGVGGDVWGLAAGAVLFWTKLSADTGLPPDQVVPVDVTDAVGAVAVGPRQLVVRGARGLVVIDTRVAPAIRTDLPDTESLPGRGAIGLGAGNSLVEATGGGQRISVLRTVIALDPPGVTRIDAVIEIADDSAAPCVDDDCAVVASAVAPDGSAVALVRRAGTDLAVSRCALTLSTTPVTVSPCEPLGTMAAGGATNDTISARHGDTEIIVTRPGLIGMHTEGEGFRPFEDGGVATSARRVGNCLVTSSSRELTVIEPGSATPRRIALDGQALTFIGVGETTTDAILVGGGFETFDQVDSAAQLYRVPLAACTPGTAVPPGLPRSQADLIGVGVRADGAVYAGDLANRVWRVRAPR